MPRTLLPCTLLCCTLSILVACSKPRPPEKERPPEPQAATRPAPLRDAIQRPIDKARAVEDTVQRAAEEQRAALDAAGG